MAKRTFAIVAVFAALLSVTLSVQAEDYDYYWTGATNNNYQNQGNWELSNHSRAPVALDGNTGDRITANIQSNSGTITLDYSNLCPQVYTVNLGQAGGSTTAKLSRSGGLTIDSGKTLNVFATGTFSYSSGVLTNAGTINVSGGTFTSAGTYLYQNGTINVSGGNMTVSASNSYRIGNNNNATLNISGDGELTVSSPTHVGVNSNTGTINQTGGTATFNGALNLGWGDGAVGQYYLSGGTLTTTGNAGLWGEHAQGISKFVISGGTANFQQSGNSFEIGLGGTADIQNEFILKENGTVKVTDTFLVDNTGILNIEGGTFKASNLNINKGTFKQSGGEVKTKTFTLASSGTYRANPGAALNVTEGSGTAALNGTIDVTGFANYVGEYGETQTIISATSISGTPTFTNTSKWTASVDGNNVIVSYNGTDDYYWTGYSGTDGQGRYCFYTVQNWKQNGSQITTGTYLNTNANCYILDTTKDGNVINVWIDYGTLGVKSLTVGSGDGTKTAKAYRPDLLKLSDSITVNKGGTVDLKGVEFYSGGKLSLTGGALNIGANGLTRNSNDTYTIKFSGGTLGNYNSNWSTSLDAEISANEVTFAPSEGNTITWSGVLSGSGGVVVDGKGSLTLSGANTYSGGTTISDGKLIVTETGALGSGAVVNNADLEFNLGGAKTISNNISGTGTITKTGSGALSLSSTSNNSIDCDLVIDQGKVILTNKIDGKNRFTKTVTINSGGTLQCDAQDSIGYSDAPATFNLYGGTLILNGHNETLKNKTVNLKGGTISSTSATSYFDVFQDGNSFHAEGTEQATAANPTVSHISGWIRLRNTTDFNITVDENAKLVVDKDYGIVDNNQSTKPLVKLGPGVLVYEGANTYTQGTTISEGTLILTENGTLGTGAVENNSILEFAHSSDKTFSNVISGTGSVTKTGSAGVLDITGANTYSGGTTITNGAIRLLGNGTLGSGEISIGSSSSLWFGGDLVGVAISNDISGAGSIVKQGYYNTVTLNGNLTNFTGQLTINGETNYRNSTISLSGANANLLNSSGVTVNGTFDVTGYTGSTAMQLNSLTGSGIVNIGSNALTLNNNTEADSIFSGAINGTSGLTKTGTGTLTLSGANTYTGMTTVSAGVLELTGDAVVANGPVTVGDNGTLVYNVDGEPEPLTIGSTNKIFSTGQVIKTGEGTLKLCALYSDAEKMIDVQSLTVSSGRVDIKEYFYGKLIVDSEGTFSPGNSVGSLAIGDGTYGGGFILNEAGAELLMEIGGSAASANDVLIVEGDITLADGSVITLVNNSNLGLGESFTAILSAENSANLDVLGHIQTTDFTELKYVQINDANHGTVYAITGRTLNANEIPEPSTWALLVLGAAGLLYWRKKKNA
ncbi:MAG: autotransporter-associated beta strand repeat-containing protein [Thermoguttaceae bacterium]|nr:autotransporter-associated beta strand repeat-containing protein [Thermoguttaceae bacterium]